MKILVASGRHTTDICNETRMQSRMQQLKRTSKSELLIQIYVLIYILQRLGAEVSAQSVLMR